MKKCYRTPHDGGSWIWTSADLLYKLCGTEKPPLLTTQTWPPAVLPIAYRRIRTAEFWVMRTPQTPYQQVCKRFRAPGVLPRIELGSDKAVLTV